MSDEFSEEDLKFEIQFYKGLIEKDETFVEAHIALAELYTWAGKIEDGLAVDEKLAQLRPEDPIILYNLACSYSLTDQVDKALRAVKKAIKCGYSDFYHMARDKDLSKLREDKRFKHFFSRIMKKNPSKREE